jgi:hypothetical protein
MAKINVRARAVDMLGRQQIAGIPTAIHELLKNAHDAYATAVDVDYYRTDKMLLIRDDGFGMTKDDFEGRWLTLGTESKVGANTRGAAYWNGLMKLPLRPIMGEKGIGRLAIAAIGPQVLVVTRALRDDGLRPAVVALVNWRLFEVPGIDLADVEIPVIEMSGDEMPDAAVLFKLADHVRENLTAMGDSIPQTQREAILTDLALLNFDPGALQQRLEGPKLGGDGHGTQFFIRPSAAILSDDIDAGTVDTASPLEKMLLGFSNTMMPDAEDPPVQTRFRDHREDGRTSELIGGGAFFTPDEFKSADHHIEGEFDEFGQFRGQVSVYHQKPVEHVIQWPRSTGKATECGAFRIRFAYVQGRATESRLPTEEWAMISGKLNRIGGLYVYRDGIRILPYGNSDFDFLNIERRRTKSAQDWFFSYRRIFGAVEISHSRNADLVEKAGREGFRSNRAYREFASILESFFERLAIDFFRPTSTFGDDFNAMKQQLTREAELLAKREKQVRARRKQFSDQLNAFFDALEKGLPSSAAAMQISDLNTKVTQISVMADAELAAQALLDLEGEARAAAEVLRNAYVLTRPRGVGMTKTQQRDWAAYLRNFDRLEAEVFRPLEQAIDDAISTAATGALAAVDRRRRVVSGLEHKKKAASTFTARLRREVGTQVKDLSEAVDLALRESLTRLASDIEQTFADLGRTDTGAVDEAALRDLQGRWETRIDESAAETKDRLERLRDQLVTVAEAVSRNESVTEMTALIETRAEGYREQLDAYSELAQVGMALGIVQHEFSSTTIAINDAIAKLQPWGTSNPTLASLVRDVRGGFDHLESYLRLFTPMSRRLNRDVIELTGEQIRIYLDEVFGDRLARHGVELRRTARFDEARVRGFSSTFLPAFVNVVDNALFWVTFDRAAERWIQLDVDGRDFLISNGGPGVEYRDADRIFEFGESNKPSGRGMGLYISRQALNREGWDLALDAAGAEIHPTFRISPKADDNETGTADD